jgi:metal-sulfur cluster biosynthetic enzyme
MSHPTVTEDQVRAALTQVIDPEIGASLVDLGLIYRIEIEGSCVRVQMTLTTQGCPMHESLVHGVKLALLNLEPVQDVEVELVWDPPWHPSMMTKRGREIAGMV